MTEIAGEEATAAQLERLYQRYYWAGTYCEGKDVLEVACGAGPGLGYLSNLARRLHGGDISPTLLSRVRAAYGDRVACARFDAQRLPFADASLDVVILFEAIYYLPNASAFVVECGRVLRPQGMVLIATANKDLFDFNPSPFSRRYYGVPELLQLLRDGGFAPEFFAGSPIGTATLRQRLLRPAKQLAVTLGLVPRTMAGKRLLKRLVFGRLRAIPAELTAGQTVPAPERIPAERPDTEHQVIYCLARRNGTLPS